MVILRAAQQVLATLVRSESDLGWEKATPALSLDGERQPSVGCASRT